MLNIHTHPLLHKTSLLLGALICTLASLAQNKTYSGKVVDSQTGEPLPYTNFYVPSGGGAFSNSEGQFLVTAQPDETVRVSFVGYETQQIKASKLTSVVKMQPMAVSLGEVAVLGTQGVLKEISRRLSRDYSKHHGHLSHYFCRMTFLHGEQTEMVEAFLEGLSAVNIRRIGVANGQYWAQSPDGRINSNLVHTNLHINIALGPMIHGEKIWRDFLIYPFPEAANEGHINRYYQTELTTMTGTDGRTIYCITLTPKDKSRRKTTLGGTIYADAETFQLLRFDGTVYDVPGTVGKSNEYEERTFDIQLKINYQHKNGFAEVSSIACSTYTDDVECHTTLVNVEDHHLPLTYGVRIDRNILEAIEAAGVNPEVESLYSFIPRTEHEMAVAMGQQTTSSPASDETANAETPIGEGETLMAAMETVSDTSGVFAYIKKAMRFATAYPQEKVYLHLDNTGYFKGETIWFKAYVVRTDTEQRTDQSRVLYVELLNPSGDVVESRKLSVRNGEAYGDIRVDSIMTTGFYELRAYTRHMTNWGTQACFSRVLPIFNAPSTPGDYSHPTIDRISYAHRLNNERLTHDETQNPDLVPMTETDGEQEYTADARQDKTERKHRKLNVRFYPEGGECVKGLPSRVAFTVTDAQGNPLDAQGFVTDMTGVRRTDTSTLRTGSGLLTLPADCNGGKLTFFTPDGTQQTFTLPDPSDEGCTLQVDAIIGQDVTAQINTSPSLLGGKLGYVVMHGGRIIRCDTLTAKPAHTISFDRRRLPDGVSQFTLFNDEGRIMAERLFFVTPKQQPTDSINVIAKNDALNPCGRVSFSLQSQPNATVSFAAVDGAGMVNGTSGNMRTWLLLASELRGYIAHPEYYLESDDIDHRTAADMLMLTQGWRRYDWNLMAGRATLPQWQPIEDKLLLYGDVKNARSGKSVKMKVDDNNMTIDSPVDVTAIFSNDAGQTFSASTPTTALGQYGFALPDLLGEWNLQLRATRDTQPLNMTVAIDRHFAPKARLVSPLETQTVTVNDNHSFRWNTPADSGEAALSQVLSKDERVLNNVTVKAKRRIWDRTGWSDEGNARRNSLIFYNCDEAADRIADEGQPTPSLTEWLHTKNSFFGGNLNASQPYLGIPIDRMEHTGIGTLLKSYFEKNGRGNQTHVLVDIETYAGQNPDDPDAPTWIISPPAGSLYLYGTGPTYKNRPIVWIIDNQFCTVTNFSMRRNGQLSSELMSTPAMMLSVLHNSNHVNTVFELPASLEDVKAIYISESNEALHNYIFCDDIDRQNPVVFYCYTHRRARTKEKGVRYTHYQGFNMPSTFQMEDYNVVPPMEDFRRTLYWNPNVKLDRRGRATVEFFNNSSCTQIFVTAEGMTSDGHPVVFHQEERSPFTPTTP